MSRVNFNMDTNMYPEIKQKNLKFREDGRVARNRSFHLRLKLYKGMGTNIPTISFSSDSSGEAETIVAKDIRGALWLLRLWEPDWKRIPTVNPEHEQEFPV